MAGTVEHRSPLSPTKMCNDFRHQHAEARPESSLHYQAPSPGDNPWPDFFNSPGSDTAVDFTEASGGPGLYDLNAHLDGRSFMNMDNVYTLNPEPMSTDTLQTATARFEMAERGPNVSAHSESSRSESVSDHKGECLGLVPDDSSIASGKAGWLSPLHIAAQKGHDRIVRVLLKHNIDCNETDSDGLTPLIHATIGGYEDVVISLLSHGVCIGKVDGQRRSALHWAVIHRREALLKMLLSHCKGKGTLVDGYDNDGRTPLHTAVDMDFESGVQILLQSGANVHYRARKSS